MTFKVLVVYGRFFHRELVEKARQMGAKLWEYDEQHLTDGDVAYNVFTFIEPLEKQAFWDFVYNNKEVMNCFDLSDKDKLLKESEKQADSEFECQVETEEYYGFSVMPREVAKEIVSTMGVIKKGLAKNGFDTPLIYNILLTFAQRGDLIARYKLPELGESDL